MTWTVTLLCFSPFLSFCAWTSRLLVPTTLFYPVRSLKIFVTLMSIKSNASNRRVSRISKCMSIHSPPSSPTSSDVPLEAWFRTLYTKSPEDLTFIRNSGWFPDVGRNWTKQLLLYLEPLFLPSRLPVVK
jgi:hypothetical protein